MSLTTKSPLYRRLQADLRAREAALTIELHEATSAVMGGEDRSEVQDFKDVAALSNEAEVQDIELDNAAAELSQVRAALRRLDDGSYGLCTLCGFGIDERRLIAMPAAGLCINCKDAAERAGSKA